MSYDSRTPDVAVTYIVSLTLGKFFCTKMNSLAGTQMARGWTVNQRLYCTRYIR